MPTVPITPVPLRRWRKNLDEMLRVMRFAHPHCLQRVLSTTNAIESVRDLDRRLKCWRKVRMIDGWTVTAVAADATGFSRVAGAGAAMSKRVIALPAQDAPTRRIA